MRRLLLRLPLLLCLLMVCVMALMQAPRAEAQEDDLSPSVLVIEPIIEATAGERIKVDFELKNLEERAIPNAPLTITLDEEHKRRVRTDEEGKVELLLTWDLPVGEYELDVDYKGSSFYEAASARLTLKIIPAEVHIEVVPPLPGITFEITKKAVEGEAEVENQLRSISDAEGNVFFTVDIPGTYDINILLEEYEPPEGMEIAFERWGDNAFAPDREVIIPRKTYLEAGFEVSYLVGQTFIDLKDEPVPEERIEGFTVRTSHGTTHNFEDGTPRMLQASRVVKRRTGLEPSPIQYSIEALYVDGTNVVNRAQQRFFIDKPDTWTIQLLLYSGYFEGRDAVFRFPIGTGIELTYPDGRVEFVEFDENGSVTLINVARGLYKVQVVLDENHWATRWGYGIAPLTPVALSRNQVVPLLVVSLLDMTLAFLIGLTIALGLLYYGRPKWFKWPPPLLNDTVPQPVIYPGYTMPEPKQRPITQRMYFGTTRLLVKLVESRREVEALGLPPGGSAISSYNVSKKMTAPNRSVGLEVGD